MLQLGSHERQQVTLQSRLKREYQDKPAQAEHFTNVHTGRYGYWCLQSKPYS